MIGAPGDACVAWRIIAGVASACGAVSAPALKRWVASTIPPMSLLWSASVPALQRRAEPKPVQHGLT